jgi:hypothetical protein
MARVQTAAMHLVPFISECFEVVFRPVSAKEIDISPIITTLSSMYNTIDETKQ